MSKGYFTDKAIQPTIADIEAVLETACDNWRIVTKHLTNELKLKGVYKFYGINYGWALRFTKSGKSVIALYPDKNRFMVQIILNEGQVEAAIEQVKNQQLLQIIRDTEVIHEGKWVYFLLNCSSDLKDLFLLINIRIKKIAF